MTCLTLIADWNIIDFIVALAGATMFEKRPTSRPRRDDLYGALTQVALGGVLAACWFLPKTANARRRCGENFVYSTLACL